MGQQVPEASCGRVRYLHLTFKILYMQKLNVAGLLALMISLSSCEVVGGIFKAGVWTGLLIVAVVIVLVIWLISKFMR